MGAPTRTGCTMGTASIGKEGHGERSAPNLCAVPPTRLRMGPTRDNVKHRCACGCWGMTRGLMRLLVLCTDTGLARCLCPLPGCPKGDAARQPASSGNRLGHKRWTQQTNVSQSEALPVRGQRDGRTGRYSPREEAAEHAQCPCSAPMAPAFQARPAASGRRGPAAGGAEALG